MTSASLLIALALSCLIYEIEPMARVDHAWSQRRPNATAYNQPQGWHSSSGANMQPPQLQPQQHSQWGRYNQTNSNNNYYNNNNWQQRNNSLHYPTQQPQRPWQPHQNQTHPWIQVPGGGARPSPLPSNYNYNNRNTTWNSNGWQSQPAGAATGNRNFTNYWGPRPNSTHFNAPSATPQPQRNPTWNSWNGLQPQNSNAAGGTWAGGQHPTYNATNWNSPANVPRGTTPPSPSGWHSSAAGGTQPQYPGFGTGGWSGGNVGGNVGGINRSNWTGAPTTSAGGTPLTPIGGNNQWNASGSSNQWNAGGGSTQWNAGGNSKPNWPYGANGGSNNNRTGTPTASAGTPLTPIGGNSQWNSGGSNAKWAGGSQQPGWSTGPLPSIGGSNNQWHTGGNSPAGWTNPNAGDSGSSASGSVPLAPIGDNSQWSTGGVSGSQTPLAPIGGNSGAPAWNSNNGPAGLSYSGGQQPPSQRDPNSSNPYANLFN